MNKTVLLFSLVAASVVLAESSEVKVNFKDLPAAVQKSAKEQSRGATIRGYSKDVEDGKTIYEVETRSGGKSKDISLDESGAVVEVEQQVSLGDLPAAVRNGLQKQANGGHIVKVESVTKGGSISSYEADVLKNGKKHEVAVTAAGQVMKDTD